MLLGLAAVSGLVPASVSAQVTGSDSVVGSAQDCGGAVPCPQPNFAAVLLTADVRSGPGGEEPTGTMTWNEPLPGGVSSQVGVTCVSVADHVAIVGVTGTRTFARIGVTVSIAGLVRVTDGGGPDSGLDTWEFDIAQGPLSPSPPPPLPGPTQCSAFPEGRVSFANQLGDLVVTDAPRLPVSKDQCKHGGWRNFPGFKNQGDCVSFVREQARRACTFELVAHGRPAFRVKYGIGPQRVLAMWACVHIRTGF